jgi:hypothetical protein
VDVHPGPAVYPARLGIGLGRGRLYKSEERRGAGCLSDRCAILRSDVYWSEAEMSTRICLWVSDECPTQRARQIVCRDDESVQGESIGDARWLQRTRKDRRRGVEMTESRTARLGRRAWHGARWVGAQTGFSPITTERRSGCKRGDRIVYGGNESRGAKLTEGP